MKPRVPSLDTPRRRTATTAVAPTLCLGSLLLLACGPVKGSFGTGDLGGDSGGSASEVPLPAVTPIPYGFWGLNGFVSAEGLAELRDRFGLTHFHTATRHPEYGVEELLPMVRESGLHVNLRLVGDHEFYTNHEGDFDIEAWKAMLDPWVGSGVQDFIDDGTLATHMLLDDIDQFDGEGPTAAELDELARYSEELLPGLPVLVRANADDLPVPEGGRYTHLDASVNQYLSQEGSVEGYAQAQEAAAASLGVGLIMGLNMANGGDGSSGQPGWEEGRYAMSAEEIVRYGDVLSATPGCSMFLNWEYDAEERWADGSLGSDYFDQPEVQAALHRLGQRLAGETGGADTGG